MKKFKLIKCLLISLCLCVSAVNLPAQFSISHSVIANGGGQGSTGGTFSLSGTAGQQVVGTNPGGAPFVVQNGFWHGDLAPTAAGVSISGRVTTANGNGLRTAIVSLTDSAGTVRTARTGSFGYYRFDDLRVGETYILSVNSKRYSFTNPTRVITLQEDLTDTDFVAEGK